VLDAACSLVEHLGPLGSGMRAKLARNLIQYASWHAAYEGQLLAEAAGIDLAAMKRIIQASDEVIGGVTTLMRDTVEPFPPGFDPGWVELMTATAGLAHKDLRAAIALAGQLEVDLPLAELTDERYDRVLGLGPPRPSAAEPA
jgi:3-hydroxyisobutyrate dehydrogenase